MMDVLMGLVGMPTSPINTSIMSYCMVLLGNAAGVEES